MILDCSTSRDSLLPAFVTLLLDFILCALFAACPDSSLVIVYSIGFSLLSLMPVIDSCLFEFETVLIKLQMDLHASDPSLHVHCEAYFIILLFYIIFILLHFQVFSFLFFFCKW